jgi:hypothetical protein
MGCAHCKKPLDDAKFYILGLGAMLREGEGRSRMADRDELPAEVFLSIGVHDHDITAPEGAWRIDLEDEMDVVSNQAEIAFCSKACMKAWFAERVDRLKSLSTEPKERGRAYAFFRRLRNLAAFGMVGCVVAGAFFNWASPNPDLVHAVGAAAGLSFAVITGWWRTV